MPPLQRAVPGPLGPSPGAVPVPTLCPLMARTLPQGPEPPPPPPPGRRWVGGRSIEGRPTPRGALECA